MAYYNGFPATYQPYYAQPYTNVQQQNQNVQPSVQGGRIWVQGEAGAKSYLVAPNSTVDLWDSESPVIYIKSADASGMPTIKVLDYTVRDSNKTIAEVKTANYATNGDIEKINGEIEMLKTKISKLVKKLKEDGEDE